MPYAYSYIRWSSDKQSAGDSERRQNEAIQNYVRKHNLTLADLTFKDAGVSAFRGKNAVEGELAAFIKAVDDGIIPKGSYLLVENFDRLSRAPVNVALRLFQDIVERDITIVTLTDEQVYNTARINENWTQLIIALAVMARAHEENQNKSKNVRKAWEQKRRDGGILTAMGPGWLDLSKDRSRWVPDRKKVATVKRIFKMAIEGMGSPSIAKSLNDSKVPTFRSADYWTSGVVAALLANQSVIGRLVSKKPGVDPIEDYYPRVIDESDFLKAQAQIRSRNDKGGVKGTQVSNLFAGMLHCSLCGSRMRTVSASGHNRYLRCLKAYSSAGCTAGKVPYEPVEDEVLKRLLVVQGRRIDVLAAMEVPDPTLELRADIEVAKRKLSNVIDMLEETGSRALAERIRALEQEIESKEVALREAVIPAPARETLRDAQALYSEHREKKRDQMNDLTELRLRLQAALRRILTRVELEPAQRTIRLTFASGTVRELQYKLPARGFQIGNVNGQKPGVIAS